MVNLLDILSKLNEAKANAYGEAKGLFPFVSRDLETRFYKNRQILNDGDYGFLKGVTQRDIKSAMDKGRSIGADEVVIQFAYRGAHTMDEFREYAEYIDTDTGAVTIKL